MKKKKTISQKITFLGFTAVVCSICLWHPSEIEAMETTKTIATHIGTFEGSTTFMTSSSNGINPGLFIEVIDDDGNLTQYESEDGIITIPDTQEGAYVTQAKLLGKTKYVDQDTGEILDHWEVDRNLRLESVEDPVLKTTTNSFFVAKDDDLVIGRMYHVDGTSSTANLYGVILREDLFFDAIPNKYCWFYPTSTYIANGELYFYDENYKFIKKINPYNLVPKNARYMKFSFEVSHYATQDDINLLLNDARIGYFDSWKPTPQYDDIPPYQSNILSTSEDVVLRGIGDARDELDLLTGEVIECIGEIVLDGSQTFNPHSAAQGDTLPIKISDPSISFKQNSSYQESWNFLQMICDKERIAETPKWDASEWSEGYNIVLISSAASNEYDVNSFVFDIRKSWFNVQDIDDFKAWLSKKPLTIQYELPEKSIKIVDLSSTHFFKPINKDSINEESIDVVGTIDPLVVSVAVPTKPLSFTLDPNQENGQQFIAPTFTLTNETLAPLQVELKSFEQTTNVLNDVLPNAHENWEGLNQKESKDFALALVPTPSEGWLMLNEESRYVANTSNELIGTIKGKSTVELTFDALHGQAFAEVLTPQYRLSFIFGFSQ